MRKHFQQLSFAGLIVALGIVYGDIGTSPLYVFRAIIGTQVVSEDLVLGGISCIIWTLTLQTTIKYIVLTLKADNKGEGGIFSLYTLVRGSAKFALFPAMVGGMALLADGIMTPAVTVTASIEGLETIPFFNFEQKTVVIFIVVIIISFIFLAQQFGTERIGRFFGPIMMVWFLFLAIMGVSAIIGHWEVFRAFNPYYAYHLLTTTKSGFLILGAVFLCTTGAEALYSDLGHCGRRNIRISWVFVKFCLILNYLGQGAYLLAYKGQTINFNPFFSIIPHWLLLGGVLIATLAAIIASQSLISGSFTLISEAIRLDLWPRMRIIYPTDNRGQLYIPAVNVMLYVGCLAMVFIFKESANMESAYGLTIVIGMLMTSTLFVFYMWQRKVPWFFIGLYVVVYAHLEGAFFLANMQKFFHGAYVTFFLGLTFFIISYVWLAAHRIKKSFHGNIDITPYLPIIEQLSKDTSIAKYATHIIYLNSAKRSSYVEDSIPYSLFTNTPKRADMYWFVRLITTDHPSTCEYAITPLLHKKVYAIDLYLGFQVPIRTDQFVRKIIQDTLQERDIAIDLGYDYLITKNIIGDYKFITIEETLSFDNKLNLYNRIIIRLSILIKKIVLGVGDRSFGIDSNNLVVEKYPIIVQPNVRVKLRKRKS